MPYKSFIGSKKGQKIYSLLSTLNSPHLVLIWSSKTLLKPNQTQTLLSLLFSQISSIPYMFSVFLNPYKSRVSEGSKISPKIPKNDHFLVWCPLSKPLRSVPIMAPQNSFRSYLVCKGVSLSK